MRGGSAVPAGGLALVVFAGIAVGAGSPIVSAGLDQDVVLGDTVYLDGGGTHVPDGELASLEWSIEAPNGSTVSPDCVDCETTSFEPSQVGQYNVTLTAESEGGVKRSDTLYVMVETPQTDGGAPDDPALGVPGSSGSGCWLASEGDDGDPMNGDVCDDIGRIERFILTESGDAITGAVFANESVVSRYPEWHYSSEGERVVPIDVVMTKTVQAFEEYYDVGSDIDGGYEVDPDEDGNEENSSHPCDNIPTSICYE